MNRKWRYGCMALLIAALLFACVPAPEVRAETGYEDALREANAALLAAAEQEALSYDAPEEGATEESVPENAQVTLAAEKETATSQLKALFTTIDLMDATVEELQEEMAAGNLTSEQLTQMYTDRINAYDEKLKLNSIISINPNAINDAKALDKERSKGRIRGPLHGVPVIVKANYDVAGMATSAGSNAFANMISPDDAFTVKKLKDAGAVILAQANMSEFAYSASDSKSTLGGTVHNAYDGSKSPAGSSGGTAVAVTSNFAAAGLGTDTGGSIRNPSSFSNLYGIRPSKGLTSVSGVFPLAVPRDTTGPMTRTAEDLALVLQTMAGTDSRDDYTEEAGADALLGNGYLGNLSKDALKGMRIGYLENSFYYETHTYDEDGEEDVHIINPDPKVEEMIKKAMANMIKAGAVFVDISEYFPADKLQSYYQGANDNTSEYDINKYLFEKGDAAPYKTLKEILLSGMDVMFTNLSGATDFYADSFAETENPYSEKINGFDRAPLWKTALKGRAEVSKILKEQKIDAVIYLGYYDAVPDLPVGDNWNGTGTAYPMIFGPALGLPEISLPMGFSDADRIYTSEMPLGISLFADFGNDETLLKIAYAYEQQAGSYIRRMPERTPALKDPALAAFLTDLMDKAYSIDYSDYNKKPEGKVQLMLNACDKAKEVDTKDPYATYEAAETLAAAYDKVMESLEESGLNPAKTDLSKCKITLSKTKYTYDGSRKKPAVTVMNGDKELAAGTDYSVSYEDNKYAGTATVTIKGSGSLRGTVTKNFTIKKAKQPLTVKAKNRTIKTQTKSQKKLTKDHTKKVLVVRNAKGKLSYRLAKVTGSKYKKYFKISRKTGKVTVKKGLKRGTYKLKIKVSTKGTSNYRSGSRTVTVKIKVK